MTDTQDTRRDTKARTKPRPERISPDGKWRSFPQVSNLVQYIPTGMYYGRVKANGKIIRRKLDTDVFSVAKLRLADFLKANLAPQPDIGTVGVGVRKFLRFIRNAHDKSERTKKYYRDCLRVLLRSWPGLRQSRADRITLEQCQEWAAKLAAAKSGIYFNNTLSVLRQVLELAGVPDVANPARRIKRVGIHHEPPTLPEADEFLKIVDAIETSGAGQARHCADLVRFLAFTGQRIGVAVKATWADVHLDGATRSGYITFRKNKTHRGKNTTVINNVPIIPELAEMLMRLQRENPRPEDSIVKVRECQRSLDRACRLAGVPRITHHDLRHLFATRCIEAGVDIPTVSRWLGHSDGGALAMRVYGHLRAKHSIEMARRVTFAPSPAENVVPMPKTEAIP